MPNRKKTKMNEMTSKERLLAAIRFQGPDRVPVSPRFWRYLLKHAGSQQHSAYLEYAEKYGIDPLLHVNAGPVHFIPPPLADTADLKDIEITTDIQKDGQYTIVSRHIQTPAGALTDCTKIPAPGGEFGIAPNNLITEHLVKDPDDLAPLRCLVRAWAARHSHSPDFRKIDRQVAGRGLLQANTLSALSHNAGDAYSLENMMIDCFERPDFVDALIDIFHQPLLESMQKALENGAEMIYCSTFYESMSSGWSPALYREIFLPRIRKQVELTHSYGALYHQYDDGKVRETLPMLKEIGVDLLSTLCPPPSGDVTPGEARELAGTSLCLNGGIDTVNVMWRGTPADVDQSVREAIAAAALPAGGYIVGTSDSITEEATPENFGALFQAVRKYGA